MTKTPDPVVTWWESEHSPRVSIILYGRENVVDVAAATRVRDELSRVLEEIDRKNGVSSLLKAIDHVMLVNERRDSVLAAIARRDGVAPCTNLSPPRFAGRWRDWHRGHGCDKDDGKPRTPEGEAEIASLRELEEVGRKP